MLAQVQMEGGQKIIKPLSGTAPINRVEEGNYNAVTSNAVASLLNTDKNDATAVSITSQVTKLLGATDVFVCRRNNMVYMYISGTYTGSPTTSTQSFITGIPEKYRPTIWQSVVLLGYNATQRTTVGRGVLYGDGSLELGETSWANGTLIRAGFIYMI